MLLAWTALMLLYSVRKAVVFDGLLYDGTFQLLNPLRRLDAGQRIGTDFQLFHGLGAPYIHYPLYAAFGRTLQSAEFSRYAVSILSHLAAIVAFCVAWGRSYRAGVVLAALGLVATVNVLTLYIPGWSSFGVRTLAPMLAVAALLGDSTRRTALVVLSVAVAFPLGTDQGLALVAGIVAGHLVAALAMPRGARLRLVVEGATLAALGVLLFVLLSVAILGDGFRPAMRYWFHDLPENQFWIFGAPPAGPTEWGVFFSIRRLWVQLVAAAVLGWLAYRRWRRHRDGDARVPVGTDDDRSRASAGVERRRFVAVACLLAYTVFSYAPILAISEVKYLDGGYRALVLLALGMTWSWAHAHAAAILSRVRISRRALLASGGAVVAAGTVVVALAATRGARFQSMSPAALSPGALAAAARAPRMAEHYTQHLALASRFIDSVGAARGDSVRVWSTFSGFIQYHRGTHAASFDYLYHTMDRQNVATYLAAFDRARPAVVETFRRNTFPTNEFLLLQWWPFFERLIGRYQVGDTTSVSLLWSSRASPLIEGATIDVAVSPTASRVVLPAEPAAALRRTAPEGRVVYVVDVSYEIANPWRGFPVLRSLPRYVISASGSRLTLPVSLSPHVRRMQFPVPIDSGAVTLDIGMRSLLPGASVRWTRMTIKPLVLSGRDSYLFDL